MVNKIKYIYITLDALREFTSNRFYQSADFQQGRDLCGLLSGKSEEWSDSRLQTHQSKEGIIFFTRNIDKDNGVLFDLGGFDAFCTDSYDKIILIFQKITKCCVRKFDNGPLLRNEHYLAEYNRIIVFPYPFVATHDVYKVVVDLEQGKEAKRKGKKIFSITYSGNEEKGAINDSLITKVIKDLDDIRFEYIKNAESVDNIVDGLIVDDLYSLNKSIDDPIGFENWKKYLTTAQLNFINRRVNGPERLEGAAGTGKTLSLVLRAINIIKESVKHNQSIHILFVTHSIATKERIIDIFTYNFDEFERYHEPNNEVTDVSIAITTLQEWSAEHLGINEISESEYLDKDACYSKQIQHLFIRDAFDKIYKNQLSGFEKICSKNFLDFLKTTDPEKITDMLQAEIGVIIKGRAKSDREAYKKVERRGHCIPLENDNDKIFVFRVFEEYQKLLEDEGKFDSDDIVLTALAQISAPIWSRRRNREGYDVCIIDETHLFNVNEVSVFHYLNKSDCAKNIIFAIDKSQAIIDFNLYEEEYNLISQGEGAHNNMTLKTMFRSSPDIANLALSIMTSGASLFKNFPNPIVDSSLNFTERDSEKSKFPTYTLSRTEDEAIANAFAWLESYSRDFKVKKSKMAIFWTNAETQKKLTDYATSHNKGYVELKSRSDSKSKKAALGSEKIIIGGIDYVGGLEFEAVAIVGVDSLRVPPKSLEDTIAQHYLNYIWHNLMYVAVTRAQYAIALFGVEQNEISPILNDAITNKLIELQ